MAVAAAVFAMALVWWAQPMPLPADADGAPRGHAAAPYDINGDGFGDAVVADAFATVSGKEWSGALRVDFGSAATATFAPATSSLAFVIVGNATVFTFGLFDGDIGETSYLSPSAACVCSGQRRSVNS